MNTKVVVIGIGGIGSEIVSELERNTDERKKGSTKFVIMDTDINTIARLKREGFSGGVVMMSERMTVKDYLEVNVEAKEWFLENKILSWKPVTEGAGQVRSVSRLAFEIATRDEKKLSPLYNAIRELHISQNNDADAENSAFRIIVVSTLAGGTGSGVVLPLALHLREYMGNVYKRKDVIIRGIFLMADCLERVVQGESEIKSLRGNTYAAMKELNAFMKKADGYLDSRYHGITLGSKRDGYEIKKREDIISYNFCYLFSARNEKSNELVSFQELKSYVMNCLYAQILGPIQELNNSIEDNVLKSTMTVLQKNGRAEFNRYCSAGIRVLEYPYKKVLQYLTVEKILEIFTQQWMEIDAKYKAEKEEVLKREKEGYYEKVLSRCDYYLRYVDMMDEGSSLIKQIKREVEEDGGEKKWEKYLVELDKEMDRSFQELRKEWINEFDCCQDEITGLRRFKRGREERVKALEGGVDDLYKKCRDEIGKYKVTLKEKYFGLIEADMAPLWHFLAWLKNQKGLMHINSARYFIYHILKQFEEKKADIEERIGKEREISEKIQDLKEFISKRQKVLQRRTYKGSVHYICEEYTKCITAIEKFCENDIKKEIYATGIEVLERISGILESFYDAYDYNRKVYYQKREDIYNQITETNDSSTVYIYTQEDQLRRLLELVTNYEKDKETNSILSKIIFMKLWEVSGGKQKDKKEKIDELFQKDCFELWEENLIHDYKAELDLNIIEAIIEEGAYKKGDLGKYNYLDEMLRNMWKRTVPFLQIESIGNQAQEKYFCTYNSEIYSENERIKNILQRELYQRGGVDSNGEVDKHKLIFYKAVYNLKAVDIKDFSPGSNSGIKELDEKLEFEEFPSESGLTFQAYYDVIDMQNITGLTPHIDKRWSNIFEMPDISSEYTRLREKKIYQAFYLMWLEGRIGKSVEAGFRYSAPIKDEMREDYSSLMDLLASLAQNMNVVKDTVNEIDRKIVQNVNEGIAFEKSYIGWKILGRRKEQFWLPYQYLSEQQLTKWDKKLINYMVEAIIDTLKIIVGRFYENRKANEELMKIIQEGYNTLEQYEKNEEAKRLCQYAVKDICRLKGIILKY